MLVLTDQKCTNCFCKSICMIWYENRNKDLAKWCQKYIHEDYIRKLENLLDDADKDQYFGIDGWRKLV